MRRVMANEKIGMNLLMCISPDHVRDDLPTDVTVRDLNGTDDSTFNSGTPVFVGITDDMGNTVTLPCFDAVKRENKLLLMAHRTGRPIR